MTRRTRTRGSCIWKSNDRSDVWFIAETYYNVSFDTDGGSTVANLTDVKYGATIELPTTTKEGYTFAGWFYADGTEFTATSTITKKTELKAKWTPKTYTIASDLRINGNETVKETGKDYAWTHRYGDEYGKPIDYTEMFAALKAKTEEVDKDNEPSKVDIELHFPKSDELFNEKIKTYGQTGANWNTGLKGNPAFIWGYATTYYNVSFDTDGGSDVANLTNVKYGSTITLPTPTKEGYTFAGWFYADGTEFTATSTITKKTELKAKWTPNKYTVTFDANGGTGTMDDQEFTYDVAQALTTNAFTKTGYTFAGWKDGSGNSYTDGQTVKNLATEGTVTLTAQWTANKYTVTFDVNGGTAADPASKEVTFDAEYGTLATTSRKGYTLVGWFTAKDGGTEVESTTVVATADDHTLYAHWTPNTYSYTIEYYAQDKTSTETPEYFSKIHTETKSGLYDTTVTLTDAEKNAKIPDAHYSFDAAQSKVSGTIDGDNTLVLKVYYKLDSHTLTYLDSRNGSVIGTTTVRCGVSVAAPKDPTKAGYWFDGWYNAADNKNRYTFPVTLTNNMTDLRQAGTMIVLPDVTIAKKTPKLNTADHFAYVQGYPDGTVKPAGNITRAETAAILFRLMDDTSRKTYYSTKSGFRDVACRQLV